MSLSGGSDRFCFVWKSLASSLRSMELMPVRGSHRFVPGEYLERMLPYLLARKLNCSRSELPAILWVAAFHFGEAKRYELMREEIPQPFGLMLFWLMALAFLLGALRLLVTQLVENIARVHTVIAVMALIRERRVSMVVMM